MRNRHCLCTSSVTNRPARGEVVLLTFVRVNVDAEPHEVPVHVPANFDASSVAVLVHDANIMQLNKEMLKI